MVLGAAAGSRTAAVHQFVAAPQLSYRTASWDDLLNEFGERPASVREVVVITDAAGMLDQESLTTLHELVRSQGCCVVD